MAFKTTLCKEGVFMLASIREVLELAGLGPAMENNQLKTKWYHQFQIHKETNKWWPEDEKKSLTLVQAIKDKKCPVVTVSTKDGTGHQTHAMIAIAVTNYCRADHYVVKNSYGIDDKPLMYIPVLNRKGEHSQRINEAHFIGLKLDK